MHALVLPILRRSALHVRPTRWRQHLRHFPALNIARRTLASTHDQPVTEDADTPTLKYTLHSTHSTSRTVRVVCVADTHNAQDDIPLPPGDILIHAGDLTTWGTEAELHKALRWLSAAPHPHKVFIAGNHDSALAIPERRDAILAAFPDLIYLEDTSVTITVHGRPLKVFGSPRTPRRGSGVFQYFIRSASWPIPPDTDILVTHGPPKFHLDDAAFGCNTLLAALWKIRPPLHVFGHIHDGRGVRQLDWSRKQEAYEASCAQKSRVKPALREVLALVPPSARKRWLWEARISRPTVLVNASWWGQPENSIESAIVVDLPLLRGRTSESTELSSSADVTNTANGLQETQPASAPTLLVKPKPHEQTTNASPTSSMTIPIAPRSSDVESATVSYYDRTHSRAAFAKSFSRLIGSIRLAGRAGDVSSANQGIPQETQAAPANAKPYEQRLSTHSTISTTKTTAVPILESTRAQALNAQSSAGPPIDPLSVPV